MLFNQEVSDLYDHPLGHSKFVYAIWLEVNSNPPNQPYQGIMRTPIQPSQLAFGSSGSIDMFSFPSRESHNNDIKPDLTLTMIGQNEGSHFSQPILRHPEPAKGKCLQQNYTI